MQYELTRVGFTMKTPLAKTLLVKDIYDKVRNEEITKRQFTEWLMLYRYKHWGIGFDEAKKYGKECGL